MTTPSIRITRIPRQIVNKPFTVSGTIANPYAKSGAKLEFGNQTIAINPVDAAGVTVPFSFQHPGFATRGMHSVKVTDALSGVSVRSNLFLVYG